MVFLFVFFGLTENLPDAGTFPRKYEHVVPTNKREREEEEGQSKKNI